MNFTRLLASVLCALISTVSQGAEKLQILTTFSPIFSFTKNIAGELADVQMLLPPGTGPHDFAFAPSDLRKLAQADVVVENGFGLEAWLDHSVPGGMKAGATRIVAARGIVPLMNAADPPAAQPNPCVWLDPVLAIREVENIRDGLMKCDPANADIYLSNANDYSTRLRILDDEIGRATVALPHRQMLTWHDAFAYFAARYGFEMSAFFETIPGQKLSPADQERLGEMIRSKNDTVLFSEPGNAAKHFATVARERKWPIDVLDPMETGPPGAEYYENVMRKNLQSLAKALK